MKAHADLIYQLTEANYREVAHNEGDLSLDDRKKLLYDLLDKNLLYVPKADVEDARFDLPEQDIQLTEDFYNLKVVK